MMPRSDVSRIPLNRDGKDHASVHGGRPRSALSNIRNREQISRVNNSDNVMAADGEEDRNVDEKRRRIALELRAGHVKTGNVTRSVQPMAEISAHFSTRRQTLSRTSSLSAMQQSSIPSPLSQLSTNNTKDAHGHSNKGINTITTSCKATGSSSVDIEAILNRRRAKRRTLALNGSIDSGSRTSNSALYGYQLTKDASSSKSFTAKDVDNTFLVPPLHTTGGRQAMNSSSTNSELDAIQMGSRSDFGVLDELSADNEQECQKTVGGIGLTEKKAMYKISAPSPSSPFEKDNEINFQKHIASQQPLCDTVGSTESSPKVASKAKVQNLISEACRRSHSAAYQSGIRLKAAEEQILVLRAELEEVTQFHQLEVDCLQPTCAHLSSNIDSGDVNAKLNLSESRMNVQKLEIDGLFDRNENVTLDDASLKSSLDLLETLKPRKTTKSIKINCEAELSGAKQMHDFQLELKHLRMQYEDIVKKREEEKNQAAFHVDELSQALKKAREQINEKDEAHIAAIEVVKEELCDSHMNQIHSLESIMHLKLEEVNSLRKALESERETHSNEIAVLTNSFRDAEERPNVAELDESRNEMSHERIINQERHDDQINSMAIDYDRRILEEKKSLELNITCLQSALHLRDGQLQDLQISMERSLNEQRGFTQQHCEVENDLNQKVKDISATVDSKQTEIDDLKEQIDFVSNKLVCAEEVLKNLSKQKAVASALCEQENIALKDKISSLQAAIEIFERKEGMAECEMDELMKKASAEIAEVQRKCSEKEMTLHGQVKHIEDALEKEQQKNLDASAEAQNCVVTISSLNRSLEVMGCELEVLVKERSQLLESEAKVHTKMQDFKSTLLSKNEIIAKLKQENLSAFDTMEELKNEICELRCQLLKVEAEREEENNARVSEEIKLQSEHDKEIAVLQSMQESKMNSLLASQNEKDNAISLLQGTVESIRAEMNGCVAAPVHEQELESIELRSTIDGLLSKLNSLGCVTDRLENEKNALKAQKDVIEKNLEESMVVLNRCQEESSNKISQCEADSLRKSLKKTQEDYQEVVKTLELSQDEALSDREMWGKAKAQYDAALEIVNADLEEVQRAFQQNIQESVEADLKHQKEFQQKLVNIASLEQSLRVKDDLVQELQKVRKNADNKAITLESYKCSLVEKLNELENTICEQKGKAKQSQAAQEEAQKSCEKNLSMWKEEREKLTREIELIAKGRDRLRLDASSLQESLASYERSLHDAAGEYRQEIHSAQTTVQDMEARVAGIMDENSALYVKLKAYENTEVKSKGIEDVALKITQHKTQIENAALANYTERRLRAGSRGKNYKI